MPAYRGGFDGLKTGTTDKAGESFVGTTVEKGMRVITVVLNADHQDHNPYARFTATSSLMDYISSTFTLRKIVQKGDTYQDSKVSVQDGEEDTVTAIAKADIWIVERIGSQASRSIPFISDSKVVPAPLEAGTVVGHLTYEDTDLIGQGYITTERPNFEMVSGKKIGKAFFLKVLWNQFIRFVNEKL